MLRTLNLRRGFLFAGLAAPVLAPLTARADMYVVDGDVVDRFNDCGRVVAKELRVAGGNGPEQGYVGVHGSELLYCGPHGVALLLGRPHAALGAHQEVHRAGESPVVS